MVMSATSAILNPSAAKSANWDNIFVGRQSFIEEIMASSKDAFIFGARRIGKTWLLQELETRFNEQGYPAFYVSLEGITNSDKLKRKLGPAFKRWHFKFDENLLNNCDFFEFLEELDAQLSHPIVFLMDEAEQIYKIDQKEQEFMGKLRNLAETTRKIRFVMAVSPHFIRLVSKIPRCTSAFLSAFNSFTLPVMTHAECCELMKCFIDSITEAQMGKLLSFTYYQPYLISIFMRTLLREDALHSPLVESAVKAYNNNPLEGIFLNYLEGVPEDDQTIVHKIHKDEFKPENEYEKNRINQLLLYGYIKELAGVICSLCGLIMSILGIGEKLNFSLKIPGLDISFSDTGIGVILIIAGLALIYFLPNPKEQKNEKTSNRHK